MDNSGRVIWICGLSGAGKSTLAAEVVRRLRDRKVSTVFLDGDALRAVFGAGVENSANHARAGRLELALRYSALCKLIADQGQTVVIATISLFREVHAWNREYLPNYFEVYLNVPFEELRRRDTKGIYRRFDSGELSNVAGLDLAVDEPQAADWVAGFEPGRTASALTDQLMNKLNEREIL